MMIVSKLKEIREQLHNPESSVETEMKVVNQKLL
jgi:hypothetical protein